LIAGKKKAQESARRGNGTHSESGFYQQKTREKVTGLEENPPKKKGGSTATMAIGFQLDCRSNLRQAFMRKGKGSGGKRSTRPTAGGREGGGKRFLIQEVPRFFGGGKPVNDMERHDGAKTQGYCGPPRTLGERPGKERKTGQKSPNTGREKDTVGLKTARPRPVSNREGVWYPGEWGERRTNIPRLVEGSDQKQGR